MSLLRTVAAETWGLFVDDGLFAAAILLWLACCWLVLPRVLPAGPAGPLVLFAGLVAILLESAARRARA